MAAVGPRGEVGLVLAPSGLLHLDGRCRATGYQFKVAEGEETLGFLYLSFKGLCRRCFPALRQDRVSADETVERAKARERHYRVRRMQTDPERWRAKNREYARRWRERHPEESRRAARESMRKYRERTRDPQD